MPWMNGKGITHEIAVSSTLSEGGDLSRGGGGSAAPFLWRLSMADLTGSGPFSTIPDVDRILVLLDGKEAR